MNPMQIAASLISEHGENIEYDRAIVEMTARIMGISHDHHEELDRLIRLMAGYDTPNAQQADQDDEYKIGMMVQHKTRGKTGNVVEDRGEWIRVRPTGQHGFITVKKSTWLPMPEDDEDSFAGTTGTTARFLADIDDRIFALRDKHDSEGRIVQGQLSVHREQIADLKSRLDGCVSSDYMNTHVAVPLTNRIRALEIAVERMQGDGR